MEILGLQVKRKHVGEQDIERAFTNIFHIIFPTFTIGLSAYIATLCVMWMRTGKEHYRALAQFWTKIFAVSFAMSGIVLSYQFGTNWSRFSAALGNVIGPMIGYEVEVAFFLEATFLGVMLFGWNRVPPWLRTASPMRRFCLPRCLLLGSCMRLDVE